jgi:hypothetical protein
MKNRIVKLIGMVIVCSMFALPVFAQDPAPMGFGVERHSLLCLVPVINEGLASETNIYAGAYDPLADPIITVSAIPLAGWNSETRQMEGPYVFSNWNQAWDDATNPRSDSYGYWPEEEAWCYYYFALNGAENVTITTNGSTNDIFEFVLFRVQYVGNGEGNSDYRPMGNFDIEILGYR